MASLRRPTLADRQVNGHDYLTRELPIETLLMIDKELQSEHYGSSLAALSLTCRALNRIFEPLLYQLNMRMAIRDRDSIQNRDPISDEDSEDEELDEPAPTCPAIIWGAFHNSIGTVKKALAYGQNVDLVGFHPVHYRKGVTGRPLHFAVLKANDELVKLLIDHGASLDKPSYGLCDCPHDSLPGSKISFSYEMSFRYDTSPKQPGWFPLHLALCRGHISTTNILIKHGNAPVRMRDIETGEEDNGDGQQVDDESDYDQQVEEESDNDQQVEEENGDGDEQLEHEIDHEQPGLEGFVGGIHTAAAFGLWSVFELMVEQGATIRHNGTFHYDVVNCRGLAGCPLHYAAKSPVSNPKETIKELLRLGADMHQGDDRGRTPFHAAVDAGQLTAAMTLLDVDQDTGELLRRIREVRTPNDKGQVAAWSIMRSAIAMSPPCDNYPSRDPIAEEEWKRERERLIRWVTKEFPLDLNWAPNTCQAQISNCCPLIWDNHTVAELIPLLIDLGADSNQQDYAGITPLCELATYYHQAFVTFALPTDAEMNRRVRDYEACIILMLEHGASIELTPKVIPHGRPLTVAVDMARIQTRRIQEGSLQLLKIFLEHARGVSAESIQLIHDTIRETQERLVTLPPFA